MLIPEVSGMFCVCFLSAVLFYALHMQGSFAISCFIWHSWSLGMMLSSWGCPRLYQAKAPASGMQAIPHIDVHAHGSQFRYGWQPLVSNVSVMTRDIARG